jgi:enoyl-CoA hydratase/carnithine racemase
VEDKGEVRWVSLNRPDTHNAFNELVIGEITDAFRTIQRDAAQHKVHHIIYYLLFSYFLFKSIYFDYL